MSRKRELSEATVWASDPHTAVKHMVYKHYLECWMSKILQTFGRATIVDAFAGPGVYSDGLAGSPLLIARTFLNHTALQRFGHLDLICLESRADRVERLRREVEALGSSTRITITVLDPGKFMKEQLALSTRAHGGERARPVLWLLDPFKISDLPFNIVRSCLNAPRDEVLITFFVDEMHRFLTRANFDKTLATHFGSDAWRAALLARGESGRKEALGAAYEEGLRGLGLLTGRFGVRVKNDTARYDVIFATHSASGLACWNPVTWKLDAYAGSGASAATAMQDDLFGTSHIEPLNAYLSTLSGAEQSWTVLAAEAAKLGFLDKHLRDALDVQMAEGRAIRVEPTKSRTRWPDSSMVRFYAIEDLETPTADPDEL